MSRNAPPAPRETAMYGYEGQKVRLVPLDRARHFENAVRWLNDPVVTQWTLTGDLPITRLHEEDWFNRMSRFLRSRPSMSSTSACAASTASSSATASA
jgi:hypothetical protein